MPIPADLIEEKIKNAMPNADITIEDLVGDQNHYQIRVKDPIFAGMARVKQHKMIYDILGDWVGGDLHALSLTTTAK